VTPQGLIQGLDLPRLIVRWMRHLGSGCEGGRGRLVGLVGCVFWGVWENECILRCKDEGGDGAGDDCVCISLLIDDVVG